MISMTGDMRGGDRSDMSLPALPCLNKVAELGLSLYIKSLQYVYTFLKTTFPFFFKFSAILDNING